MIYIIKNMKIISMILYQYLEKNPLFKNHFNIAMNSLPLNFVTYMIIKIKMETIV